LARGGGSIEDLWCFNHEGLARSIRNSSIPVISAVGHEIDFTISDFVADLRAPTPSAASEILSGHWVEAVHRHQDYQQRMRGAILRDLGNRRKLLTHIAARVVSPKDRLREQAQKTDELVLRLERAAKMGIERKKSILVQCAGKLDALSPLRVLERGYTLVKDAHGNGSIIKSASSIQPGQELEITFYDGKRAVQAI